MSMPSSRLLVATTAGSRPAFRSSSIRARCSLLTEPWCARAIGGGSGWPAATARSRAISLTCAVMRSARRRLLAKTRVVRCCSMRSTSCSSMCGQIDVRATEPAALPEISVVAPSSAMSSTGTRICRSHCFSLGGATMVAGRDGRTNVATVSSGLTVADRPIRWAGRSSSRSRRSRDSARWAPRLVPAMRVHLVEDDRVDAAQGLARLRRQHEEERLRRRDEDVGRAPGQPGALGRRRVAGADADGDVGGLEAEAGRLALDADERAAQVALDVDREGLERRHVQHAAAAQAVVGDRVVHQPVDRVQEGGEGLAAARGRHDEGVVALRDRRPCARPGRAWPRRTPR